MRTSNTHTVNTGELYDPRRFRPTSLDTAAPESIARQLKFCESTSWAALRCGGMCVSLAASLKMLMRRRQHNPLEKIYSVHPAWHRYMDRTFKYLTTSGLNGIMLALHRCRKVNLYGFHVHPEMGAIYHYYNPDDEVGALNGAVCGSLDSARRCRSNESAILVSNNESISKDKANLSPEEVETLYLFGVRSGACRTQALMRELGTLFAFVDSLCTQRALSEHHGLCGPCQARRLTLLAFAGLYRVDVCMSTV